MILNEVKEYAEEYPVELMLDIETNRYCVVALNEGGHNSVCIDAEQLYYALKEFFENIHKGDD